MSERKSIKRTFGSREPMTLGQMAELVQAAEEAKLAALRAYDLALAKAYMSVSGPQSEKRHLAELKTAEERERAEVATAAFAHAQREMKALETQLSAAREAKAPDDTRVKVLVNFSAGVKSAEIEW